MEKPVNYQRYRFIELMAYWEGRINTTILKQQFRLSRQHDNGRALRERVDWNTAFDAMIIVDECRALRERVDWNCISNLLISTDFCRAPRERVDWNDEEVDGRLPIPIMTNGYEFKGGA